MKTIFENKENIKKSDIPTQIGRGILFIILIFVVSKIRFINKEISPNITLIFGISLFLLFIYLILTSKTIKRIEKLKNKNKLIFTFSRQLRADRITEFNLSDIKLTLKTIPGRSLPYRKILLISDNENELKLSTNQKGITETELNKIISRIENTTHNTS